MSRWKFVVFGALTIMISGLVALALAESLLIAMGKYHDQVNAKLTRSEALWENTPNTTAHFDHPDVVYDVANIYDSQGARVADPSKGPPQKDMIAFFGDSFTINRNIREDLTFTAVLNNEIVDPRWTVRNYAVAGYGPAQSFIRYRQLADTDIKHVFYVFFSNDLDDIYRTELVSLDNGILTFHKPAESAWRRFLGKFRLTYLFIDSYVRWTNPPPDPAGRDPFSLATWEWATNWTGIESAYEARVSETREDKLVASFVSDSPSPQSMELAKTLIKLLELWQETAKARGQKFSIIVLPYWRDIEIAKKIGFEQKFDTVFLVKQFGEICAEACAFKNDGHWNEQANLRAALALSSEPQLAPYLRPGIDRDYIKTSHQAKIREFYAGHKSR